MKPIAIRTFLGLAAALAFVHPLAEAHAPNIRQPLAGTEIVADVKTIDTNEPVTGVTVTLTGKLTTVAFESCITDEEGRVRMHVKKPGIYTVRVSSDDFERAEADITVVAGDKERNILLFLTPKTAAGNG